MCLCVALGAWTGGGAFAQTPPAPQDPQEQPPPTPPPAVVQDPGVRVQAPDDVVVDPSLVSLKDKLVRAIQVARAAAPGVQAALWEPAAAETLVRSLETRVGQPFEARKVSADCATLWRERRVLASAYAREVDGEVLVTFVVEREVEVYDSVEFVGNDNLDVATIHSLLGLTPDRQVTRTEAEAMRKVLKARYGRDGYANCSITLVERPAQDLLPGETMPASGPTRRLRFQVDEGPKIAIGTITFLGNKQIGADALFGFLGPDVYLIRDSRIASTPSRGVVRGAAFSREVLDEDLDRLRSFYRGRGFLDATVDLGEVRFGPDRTTADVTFLIVEGPRYRIRSVKLVHVGEDRRPIEGAPLHPVAEVEKELKLAVGEFYDQDKLQRDVQAVYDYYGRRGHPPFNFAGMQSVPRGCRVFDPVEVYGDDATVDIVYQVSEGVPKDLRDLVIRGNAFTRDKVIRRRIRVLPGDRIDMVEVKRGLRNLEQMRYFQDATTQRGPRLQLEPVPGQPELVDVGLDVQDGSTGELRWGVGISTGMGFSANMTFNKRNFDLWNPPSSWNPITAIGEILDNEAFHGGGQTLQLFLAPGNRVSQYQVTWIEPDVFAMHFDTYELRVTGRRLVRYWPDGYTSDTFGGSLGLSRHFSDSFSVGASVREEGVKVRNLAPDATSLAYAAEGHTELRGMGLNARLRDVDDFIRPTSGYDFTLSGEVVGGPFGGQADFTKLTHTADVYSPVAENERGHRTVLHVKQFFGVANAFGDSDRVFLTERFYMGAYNLRGFGFRRAGPKQFGRPLGGEAQWTGTVEMSFPLVATRVDGGVRDQELLRWVAFTDFGLLGTDISDRSFRQLRAASGVGLRIQIPGLNIPVAIDVGWPWRYYDTDDRDQVYFSIGTQ